MSTNWLEQLEEHIDSILDPEGALEGWQDILRMAEENIKLLSQPPTD